MSGKRIHLSVLSSTNSYTIELLSQNGIESWTVVSCDHQSAGKGQRGKRWEVEPEANLTFSVAIEARIGLEQQYIVSSAAVLAVVNTLEAYGIDARFKWPNDILVEGEKIAGILIENQVADGMIRWSVIGIGLNVNQTHFPPYDWPATSMKRIRRGLDLDKEEVLSLLLQSLKQAWFALAKGKTSANIRRMDELLFGFEDEVQFEVGGKRVVGMILGLAHDGGLRLALSEGVRTFYNGELKLLRSAS